MGLSDFPARPARVLTDRRLRRPLPTHEEGSPVLTRQSFARMPSPLPRCPEAVPLSLTSRFSFGLLMFATRSTVTLPRFRGLLSVHYSLGPARSLIPSKGPFPPEALATPVAQDSHSGCFRLERQLPGGIPSSHWTNAPFSRRTANRRQCCGVGSLECGDRCRGLRPDPPESAALLVAVDELHEATRGTLGRCAPGVGQTRQGALGV